MAISQSELLLSAEGVSRFEPLSRYATRPHSRDRRATRFASLTVDDGGMKEQERDSSLRRALDQAYRYLSYRARSIHELKEYLVKKGHCDAVVGEVIVRLTKYGYLDDLEFARQFARSKGDWGPRRLRYELRRKQVEPSVIDRVMPGRDDERRRCRRLAVAYLRRRGTELDYALRRRLWAYLTRRGFSRDAIESAVRWIDEGTSSD